MTAVEWLIEQIMSSNIETYHELYERFEKAKEMEAEQSKIPELSDEEIEEEYDLPSWVDGAKWYREQLKQRQ